MKMQCEMPLVNISLVDTGSLIWVINGHNNPWLVVTHPQKMRLISINHPVCMVKTNKNLKPHPDPIKIIKHVT